MANGGEFTNQGVNVELNRSSMATPDKTPLDQFKIGAGTTTPAITDTDTEIGVPINEVNVELIDHCNAADWTQGGAGLAEATNTVTFKEGKGDVTSLEIPKDNSGTLATWEKTLGAALDGTDKDFFMWFYIKDATTLDKFATSGCLVLRFGSDNANYYSLSKNKSELIDGWNLIKSPISSMSTTGSPVLTALDYLQIRLTTTLAADTFTSDDVIMDYWHLVSADDYYKSILTVEFDEVNKRRVTKCYVNSLEANGYLITEIVTANQDSPVQIGSHDVHNAISKSSTDEITYIITDEADNTI